MEGLAVGGLLIFLIGVFIDAKRRSARHIQLIAEEKSEIAGATRMTATIGVFHPDVQTTVVMGASEEMGALYYRVLRGTQVLNRSKINLSNVVRVELLINGTVRDSTDTSEQPNASLKATEVTGKSLGRFTSDAVNALRRIALRVVFVSETGAEKTLEITVMRFEDERQRSQRIPLLKTALWWSEFLNLSGRSARHTRNRLEVDPADLQHLQKAGPVEAPSADPAGSGDETAEA